MATFDGYIGVIYVTLDREAKIDLYYSGVWDAPEKVLDDFWENRLEIMEILARNSDQYDGFDAENSDSVEEYAGQFQEMIGEFRDNLKRRGIDEEDDFEDINISIKHVPVHLS